MKNPPRKALPPKATRKAGQGPRIFDWSNFPPSPQPSLILLFILLCDNGHSFGAAVRPA